MSLMNGTGPFGHAPAGVFNAEVPREGLLYFEPLPRRMRGLFAGETVVDSRRVKLLYERGRPPVAFFNERVEIEVDGEVQERLASAWSAPGWWNRIREIEAQL